MDLNNSFLNALTPDYFYDTQHGHFDPERPGMSRMQQGDLMPTVWEKGEDRLDRVHAAQRQLDQIRRRKPFPYISLTNLLWCEIEDGKNPFVETKDPPSAEVLHDWMRNGLRLHLKQVVHQYMSGSDPKHSVCGPAHLPTIMQQMKQYSVRPLDFACTDERFSIVLHRIAVESAREILPLLRDPKSSTPDRVLAVDQIQMWLNQDLLKPIDIGLQLGELEFALRRILVPFQSRWKAILTITDSDRFDRRVQRLLHDIEKAQFNPALIDESLVDDPDEN